jgi:hypothetical protein
MPKREKDRELGTHVPINIITFTAGLNYIRYYGVLAFLQGTDSNRRNFAANKTTRRACTLPNKDEDGKRRRP